ncbi:hypothetical protein SEA_MALIBO_10 [Gordonia phage Malibo]|nr:hypothetical protein SEA_MALIBO_10 [Gordonia phage Malibo]
MTFRLNRRGVSELLKTQAGEVVNEAAEQIRAQVAGLVDDDIEVTVQPYTTDRGAAAVTIADPQGMELQATTGALTRAAAQVGLEVTSR